MTSQVTANRDFEIAGSLEAGWNLLGKRPGALLGYGALFFGVYLVMMGIAVAIQMNAPDHKLPAPVSITMNVVQGLMTLIYVKVIFLCMDDQPADMGSVFSVLSNVISYWAASCIFVLGAILGCLLLIVPGIIFMVGCGFFPYAIVDKGMGPIEALKYSWEITSGSKWKLIGFFIVIWLIMFGGMLCFLVGIVPAYIVSMVGICHAFRQLAQQNG